MLYIGTLTNSTYCYHLIIVSLSLFFSQFLFLFSDLHYLFLFCFFPLQVLSSPHFSPFFSYPQSLFFPFCLLLIILCHFLLTHIPSSFCLEFLIYYQPLLYVPSLIMDSISFSLSLELLDFSASTSSSSSSSFVSIGFACIYF